jgi:hypothetical protein
VTVTRRHSGYSRDYVGGYPAKLMQELGEGVSVDRLAERSKCSQCGVKRMRFTIEPRDKAAGGCFLIEVRQSHDGGYGGYPGVTMP